MSMGKKLSMFVLISYAWKQMAYSGYLPYNFYLCPTLGKGSDMKRVLVFVLYKKEATRIEEFLQRQGWKVTSVQGDKSQAARQKAVDDFKAGKIPILIATDVAARGLDIPGVDLVINFSFPLTIEDYGNYYLFV